MILAIDDDPTRYEALRAILAERPGSPLLVVASCPACVGSYVLHARAVLLDYDLDRNRDPDTDEEQASACTCGTVAAPGHNGGVFVPLLQGRRVIVTSANPGGAALLARQLGAPRIRILDMDATERVVCQLWRWGVL